MLTEKDEIRRASVNGSQDFGHINKDFHESDLIEAAIATGEEETKLSLRELFRQYGPAAMWSMLLSLALVMEGMDVGLVNNFFGQQAYINKFGHTNEAGVKFIPPDWQAAINNGQQVGAVLGLLFNGWAQSRFGSRKIYMLSMVMLTGFITYLPNLVTFRSTSCLLRVVVADPSVFVLVFAENLPMLMVGNMLCGFPWGVFQTLTTAYAAEICPVAMRGYLTSWVSMCWGCGSFLAAGVLRASLTLPGDWAWRMPYILQWAWPVPLFFVGYFAPESPWYLIRNERYEDAESALIRLARKDHYTPENLRAQIALMKHTNERQKLDAANVNYFDCFRNVNLRRTEIACVVFALQVWSGQGICSYATTFLRNAGMSEVNAFNYSMGIQCTNILTTGIAILLIGRYGRRYFYLYGLSAIGLWQLIVGILGFVPSLGASISVGVAVMMILINMSFKLSIGPSCYTIISEVPNTRIRAHTIVIARASYIISGVASNQLIPRMLGTSNGWGWGAKCGLFWCGCCILAVLYTYFRIPETRNRTFLELDYLFHERVPARKFRTTQISLSEINGSGVPIPANHTEAVIVEKKNEVEEIEAATTAVLTR